MRDPIPTVTGPGAFFTAFILFSMWEARIGLDNKNLSLALAILGSLLLVYNVLFYAIFHSWSLYQKFGYQKVLQKDYTVKSVRDFYNNALYVESNNKIMDRSVEMLKLFVSSYTVKYSSLWALIISNVAMLIFLATYPGSLKSCPALFVILAASVCIASQLCMAMDYIDDEMTEIERSLLKNYVKNSKILKKKN